MRRFQGCLMTPLYWAMARASGAPGLAIHWKAAVLGAKSLILSRLPFSDAYGIIFFPMDSVRYFEFEVLWEFLQTRSREVRRYLDVSSPRLFPILALSELKDATADIANPDGKDLDVTRTLATAAGVSERCRFHPWLVDDFMFSPESFDLVTSISAIEHIPSGGDHRAVKMLWGTLTPGGRLLLSVPCAREAFEERMDFNEYGILGPDADGSYFGSTFYDASLIEERIFRVTGRPARYAICGERAEGLFFRNRSEKISNPNYPFWREPYMMAKEYRRYGSIDELPGIGVIAMEFIKR